MTKFISNALVKLLLVIGLVTLVSAVDLTGRLDKKYQQLDSWIKENALELQDDIEVIHKTAEYAKQHLSELKDRDLEAFQSFAALELLNSPEESKCSINTTEVLAKNAANAGVDLTRESFEPKNLVQKIIRNLAKKHASDCESFYLRQYQDLRKTFAPAEFNQVAGLSYNMRTFLNNFNNLRPGLPETEKFFKEMRKLDKKKLRKIMSALIKKNLTKEQFEVFNEQIMNKEDGEDVDKKVIIGLIREIQDQCQSYNLKFGYLFGAVKFDAGVMPTPDRYGGEHLANGLVNYQVCEFLLSRKPKDLFDNVERLVPDKLPRWARKQMEKEELRNLPSLAAQATVRNAKKNHKH